MSENIYDPGYVKGLFNRMSTSYERMNYLSSFGFSLRWRRQFQNSFVQPAYCAEVIDLLTGMGETWATTKKQLPDSHLTVLDFSEGMLRYARKKNEIKFNNQVRVIEQDVLQSNLPDNYFDFVTCAFGLKTFHPDQIGQLAQEVKRILKPGGSFSFIEVSQPRNRLLNFLYGLYLGNVVPFLGRLLLGNPREYRMLWQYTSRFKNARMAADVFAASGLQTQYREYFFGCASGFSGSKQP